MKEKQLQPSASLDEFCGEVWTKRPHAMTLLWFVLIFMLSSSNFKLKRLQFLVFRVNVHTQTWFVQSFTYIVLFVPVCINVIVLTDDKSYLRYF